MHSSYLYVSYSFIQKNKAKYASVVYSYKCRQDNAFIFLNTTHIYADMNIYLVNVLIEENTAGFFFNKLIILYILLEQYLLWVMDSHVYLMYITLSENSIIGGGTLGIFSQLSVMFIINTIFQHQKPG